MQNVEEVKMISRVWVDWVCIDANILHYQLIRQEEANRLSSVISEEEANRLPNVILSAIEESRAGYRDPSLMLRMTSKITVGGWLTCG